LAEQRGFGDLFGIRAGQVDDYRVYMDINPVFAA
jgi:hypothetical protein